MAATPTNLAAPVRAQRMVSGFCVQSGIPIPEYKRGRYKRSGKWQKLLEAMQPGESVILNARQLTTARNSARRLCVPVVIEHQGGGKGRVWKAAKPKLTDAGDKPMNEENAKQPVEVEQVGECDFCHSILPLIEFDGDQLCKGCAAAADASLTSSVAVQGRVRRAARGSQASVSRPRVAEANAPARSGVGGEISPIARAAAFQELKDQADWIPGHDRPHAYGYHVQVAINDATAQADDACEQLELVANGILKELDSAKQVVAASRELYTAYALVRKTEASEDDHYRLIVAHDDLHAALKAFDAEQAGRAAAAEGVQGAAPQRDGAKPANDDPSSATAKGACPNG